tara:strand:+ start:606 stop:1034 length:429 start_codon:yes stop_codon:yes gene_type:complete
MLQKKVKKRASLLAVILTASVISIFLILSSLNKNILYFKSPTEIKNSQDVDFNKKLRVGGMVKKDTLKINEEEIKFIITDFKNEIKVSFRGTVPNLFSEGKGVVAEGRLQDKKFFIADRILAKHDENYMPPELKKIMKEDAK